MATTIDHLTADHRVRILQDFRDARGHTHRANETAVIRHIGVDWKRQEIEIQWERDDAKETVVFSMLAKDGPRDGSMREYFAVEERVPSYEDTWEGRRERKRRELRNSIPAVNEQLVIDPKQYSAAIARLGAR